MLESDFQADFSHSVRKLLSISHYYKIPDPAKSEIHDRKVKTIKRPYDCYLLFGGTFYAFELKIMDKCADFPFAKVQDHQREFLAEVSKNGGRASVLIAYNFKPNTAQLKKYKLKLRYYYFCFALDIKVFETLASFYRHQGKKSIPFDVIIGLYRISHGKGVIVQIPLENWPVENAGFHFLSGKHNGGAGSRVNKLWDIQGFIARDWVEYGIKERVGMLNSGVVSLKDMTDMFEIDLPEEDNTP